LFDKAARLIEAADSLIITAGAGMGVDSGLPDFRGPQGFWRAYPALGKAGLRFEQIASPDHFHSDPALAWGFYGHRLALYRATVPHPGFRLVHDWGRAKPRGLFVFTSNVDGQFQKAGLDGVEVIECHGSIHHLQCLESCSGHIWSADTVQPVIDEERCRMISPLPRCPRCGALARPNILMFGDWGWNEARTASQQARFEDWRVRAVDPVVIELGAGTAIPSVRAFGERQGAPLVRINPAEAAFSNERRVNIPLGALEALQGIAQHRGQTPSGKTGV
jgi:NAD-dependent SIR2 family protein deacetylase